MNKNEALRLALEALYGFIPYLPLEHNKPQCDKYDEAITAIKAALANEALERKAENARELGLDYEPLEAKDEPVAWQWLGSAHFRKKIPKNADKSAWNPVYHSPPQRTWTTLTDEEFLKACQLAEDGNYLVAFQRIQQWLKEKNK